MGEVVPMLTKHQKIVRLQQLYDEQYLQLQLTRAELQHVTQSRDAWRAVAAAATVIAAATCVLTMWAASGA